ncbi:MAG: hypothetical protein ACI38U_11060 [Corynebacterium sp.]|uniref:hypothetical protein n=1 Tax=Corynebacterium sp. TaxID=1720 RepID=UPI003F07DF23
MNTPPPDKITRARQILIGKKTSEIDPDRDTSHARSFIGIGGLVIAFAILVIVLGEAGTGLLVLIVGILIVAAATIVQAINKQSETLP